MNRPPQREKTPIWTPDATRPPGGGWAVTALAVAALIALPWGAGAALAGPPAADHRTAKSVQPQGSERRDSGRFCTQSANTLYRACGFETQDDYWVAIAQCINESDDADRAECQADAEAAKREQVQHCREVLDGRLQFCRALGEARYDPDFDEQLFETDYTNLPSLNPFFPIAIDNHWEFAGAGETVAVDVLDRTKLIDGVTCIVVRDIVSKNGAVVEATDDWLAQAKDGNVWYCGEEVKDQETFEGDDPPAPELVSIDGSFKVGRDGAKAGILYLRHPVEGQVYREEFSIGNAEDVSRVESADYTYGEDEDLDRWVPANLGTLLCGAGGCVVTENKNLLDPGDLALKYYTPGIGVFLEVHPDTGETVQIVGCNMDPRCGRLPGR